MELICTLITTILLVGVIIIFSLLVDNKSTPIEEPKPFEPKPAEPKPIRTTAKSLYANPPVYSYATSDLVSPALTAAVLTTELTESKPYIRESQYESITDDSETYRTTFCDSPSSYSSSSCSDSSSSSSSGGCD